jgi:hypothetical protein
MLFPLFLALPLPEALSLAFPEALPSQSAPPLYLFFCFLLISILFALWLRMIKNKNEQL